MLPSSLLLRRFFALALATCLVASRLPAADAAMAPAMGEQAPNFTLRTLERKPVELAQLVAQGPVVLVVLRGWPGYQCPLCTKQVQDYIAKADLFKARGAQVLLVYPGPAEKLEDHAREFLSDKQWPAEFVNF